MKVFSVFIVLSFLGLMPLMALNDSYNLNQDRKQWQGVASLENLNFHILVDGRREIELHHSQILQADLSLPFEQPIDQELTNYRLRGTKPTLSQNRSQSGFSSAAFHGNDAITLQPLATSLFNQEASDFTIDFWVYPTRMAEGDQIFSYQGTLNQNGQQVFQSLNVTFELSRLVWQFENIFQDATGQSFNIELTSNPMTKDGWHRHTLRYNNTLGMIELLDNGLEVDIKYINHSGKESRQELFQPTWQNATAKELNLGMFAGYLDNFNILPYYQDELDFNLFTSHGSLITQPFNLQGASLKEIKIEGQTPGDSQFRTFVRFANFKTHLDDNQIEWELYNPLTNYSERPDIFVQFKIDFFAGNAANSSPVLQNLVVVRNIIPPPPRPGRVSFVRQSHNSVIVKWQPLLRDNVAGYKLYFGTSPSEYFGSTPQLISPIDVGQATEIYIDNLKEGTLYYFTITAYDDSATPQESAFAPEASFLP